MVCSIVLIINNYRPNAPPAFVRIQPRFRSSGDGEHHHLVGAGAVGQLDDERLQWSGRHDRALTMVRHILPSAAGSGSERFLEVGHRRIQVVAMCAGARSIEAQPFGASS